MTNHLGRYINHLDKYAKPSSLPARVWHAPFLYSLFFISLTIKIEIIYMSKKNHKWISTYYLYPVRHLTTFYQLN